MFTSRPTPGQTQALQGHTLRDRQDLAVSTVLPQAPTGAGGEKADSLRGSQFFSVCLGLWFSVQLAPGPQGASLQR